MMSLGYEDIFDRDFNGDGFTGITSTVNYVDDNNDGLVDGSSAYKLLQNDQVINLSGIGRKTRYVLHFGMLASVT